MLSDIRSLMQDSFKYLERYDVAKFIFSKVAKHTVSTMQSLLKNYNQINRLKGHNINLRRIGTQYWKGHATAILSILNGGGTQRMFRREGFKHLVGSKTKIQRNPAFVISLSAFWLHWYQKVWRYTEAAQPINTQWSRNNLLMAALNPSSRHEALRGSLRFW